MAATAEGSSPSLLPLSTQQLGAATELAISGQPTNASRNGAGAIYDEEPTSTRLYRRDQFLRHPSLYSANESGEHARFIRGRSKNSSYTSNPSRADPEEQDHHKGKWKNEHRQSGPATATIPWINYVPTYPPPPTVTVTDWSSLPSGIESVPTPLRPPRPPSVFIPTLVVTPCSTPSTTGEEEEEDSLPTAATALASDSGIDSASSETVLWASPLQEDTSFSKYDRTSPLDRIGIGNAVNMDYIDAYRTQHLSPDSAATYHSTIRTPESKIPHANAQKQQQPAHVNHSNRNNPFFGTGTYMKEQKYGTNEKQNSTQRRVSFVLPDSYKGVRLLPIEPVTPPELISASPELLIDSLVEATLRDYKCDPSTISRKDLQVINASETPPLAYTTSTPSKHRGGFDANSPLPMSIPSELRRRDELEIMMSNEGYAEIDLSDIHLRQEGLSMIEEIDEENYFVGAMDSNNPDMLTASQKSEPQNTRQRLDNLQDQEDLLEAPYTDIFDLDMYFDKNEEDEDSVVSDSWKQFYEINLGTQKDVDNEKEESFMQTLYCDIVFNTSDPPFSAKRFGFISTQPPLRFTVLAPLLSQASPDTPSPDLNSDTPSFIPDTPSPLPSLPVDTIRPTTAGVSTLSERTQRYRDHYRHPAYSCPAHLSGSSQDKDNSSSSTQSATSTSTASGNPVTSIPSTATPPPFTTPILPSQTPTPTLNRKLSSKGKAPALPVTARITQSKSDSKKKVSVKAQGTKSILGVSHEYNVRTHMSSTKAKGGRRKGKEREKENHNHNQGSHDLAPTPTATNQTRATTRPLPKPIVIVSHHHVDSMPTDESYSRRIVQAPPGHSVQRLSDEGSFSQEVLRARLKETCDNFSKSVWTDDSYTLEAISFAQD